MNAISVKSKKWKHREKERMLKQMRREEEEERRREKAQEQKKQIKDLKDLAIEEQRKKQAQSILFKVHQAEDSFSSAEAPPPKSKPGKPPAKMRKPSEFGENEIGVHSTQMKF